MKALTKEMLRRLSYRLGYQNLDHLNLLLESRIRKVREFFVVQIGANDGTTYDPIHDFIVRHRDNVRGVMLEPVPEFHAQLAETYRDFPAIRTLPLAIHASEKTMEIHRVDRAKLGSLPSFVKGIASFDREYHRKSGTPPEAIVSERVDCITTKELIAMCGIRKIDLLLIDTEGYDAEILLSFDFDAMQPAIVMFEHGLRDGVMERESFARVITLLNRFQYDVMIQDYDAIAHLRHRLAISEPA